MSDQTDIESVDSVDVPELGNIDEVRIVKVEQMTADGTRLDLQEMALPKDGWGERAIRWLMTTLAGENRTGKVIARVKDVLSFFVPAGSEIDRLTDAVGDNLKQKHNTMATSNESAEAKPKLLITNIVIGLASALVLVGVLPVDTLELSADAAWVGFVYSIVNGVWNYFDGNPTK